MNKQGMELALNTIIVAVIALLVLLILIIVFTGGIGDVTHKFTGIKDKVSGKADCVVIGQSDDDSDADGYLDSKSYTLKVTIDGKITKVDCNCDWEVGATKTTKDSNQKKYC